MTRRSGLTRRSTLKGAAAAGLATVGLFGRAAASNTLRIGSVVPLTGPFNASGQQYHFSLQMVQDEINAKGGIAGQKLEIVFADSRDSNAAAVNAFIKLNKELNAPFMFLSSYTTQNLATEPEVTKAALPCVYAGGGDAVHERKNRWMFRIRPYDGLQSQAMTQVLLKDLGAKKPAILYVQTDFGQGVANTVQRLCKTAGVETVGVESYGVNDKDMSAQLLGFKAKGADALVLASYGNDGALIIKQIKQFGITTPLITAAGVMAPAVLNLLTPEEVSRVHGMIDSYVHDSRQDATGDYARRFHKRFGVKPDPFGSCYYDAAWMLKEGIEKVGTDREKLRTWFAQVKNWKGVTHTYSTDEHNNMVHSFAIVKFKPGSMDLEFVRTLQLS
jgi:branched-chain amino acid transport system substrate-binding protein